MAPKVTEEHKRRRRVEILEAAKRVFNRLGYLNTTMQDVIDEVGLSRGAVYAYFANKSDLFKAVIEMQDTGVFQLHNKIIRSRPIWPAFEENLLIPFEHYDDSAPREIGAHIEFVLESRNEEEQLRWVVQRYQHFAANFIDIFETGTAIGEFHPVLPLDVIAQFTISAMDGIHMGVMAAGTKTVQASEQTDALRKFLTDNLRPRATI